MNVLVTGSSGFVGSSLLQLLSTHNIDVLPVVRNKNSNGFFVKSINGKTDWHRAFEGIEVVVHLAGCVHKMNDEVSLKEYSEINVDGTLNLAKSAADNGVRRFIFISTIKVNGESTTRTRAFEAGDDCNPQDAYGVSKYQAEVELFKISKQTGMEVVIIRPPLVYGKGVKGNFYNLLKLSDTAIPLPFGVINNHRSMIYVGNLVDFILKCISHPAAANQTFLVSDDEDLSLPRLLGLLRADFKRARRLIPVPAFLFHWIAKLTGKSDVVDRLIGDLQIDTYKARQLLEWKPPFMVEEGIKATVESYLEGKD
ncbi:MAG: NAD-dependent epimerase/dehydratase family protein [Endozoicomonas sp.]